MEDTTLPIDAKFEVLADEYCVFQPAVAVRRFQEVAR